MNEFIYIAMHPSDGMVGVGASEKLAMQHAYQELGGEFFALASAIRVLRVSRKALRKDAEAIGLGPDSLALLMME
jgi:hypothetical protein